MPKRKKQTEPRRPPTKAEAIARRNRVIEYYETVANRNKKLTCYHFGTEFSRRYIYRVLKTHEQRKKDGHWKRKYTGGRRTVATPENLRKLEELYRMDPNVTVAEACQILNLQWRSSFYALKKLYDRVKKGASATGETVIDYPNIWSANTEETTGGGGGNMLDSDNYAHFDDSDPHEFPVSNGDSDNDENEKKVVADPKQKPKKLKKTRTKLSQNAQRCLACFEAFEFESGNEGKPSSELQDSLNMVFVFKNLLGLSSKELVDVLKISKGANPNKWVNFCVNCRALVEEAAAIPRKIRELEERLAECKEQLTAAIKNTWSYRCKSICVNEKLHVTRRVRDIVKKRRPSKCSHKVNPFEDGDKQAESLLPPPSFQVKQEAEEPCDVFSECFDPGPSSFLDTEDSLGISDILKTNEKETDFPSSMSSHSSITELISAENEPLPSFKMSESDEVQGKEAELIKSTPESATISGNRSDPVVTGNNSDIIDPTPLPTSTQGICDTCGLEMRPLAIPSHKLNVHGVIMEGFTVKLCTKQGCDYKTLYDIKLKNHLKKHELEATRPFCCSWCSMRFLTRRDLDQHEEIHKNADSRPYVCDLCGSSFAVKNYLYLHKRLSHEKRYFPSTKRKKPIQKDVSSASNGEETREQTSS